MSPVAELWQSSQNSFASTWALASIPPLPPRQQSGNSRWSSPDSTEKFEVRAMMFIACSISPLASFTPTTLGIFESSTMVSTVIFRPVLEGML